MKHIFTLLALIAMLTCGSAKAIAQDVNREQFAYENTKTFIHQGDEEYKLGSYNTAEWYYNQARNENDNCKHKFINPNELEQKIAECKYAQKCDMSRENSHEQQLLQTGNAKPELITAIDCTTGILSSK